MESVWSPLLPAPSNGLDCSTTVFLQGWLLTLINPRSLIYHLTKEPNQTFNFAHHWMESYRLAASLKEHGFIRNCWESSPSNAQAIRAEGQYLYYLIHSRADKRVHTLNKGISWKWNQLYDCSSNSLHKMM